MQLIIGNKNYSSWSMRVWLTLRFLKIPFDEIHIDLYVPGAKEKVKELGGETGLVPVIKDEDIVLWETSAIIDHLYETYAQIWPKDVAARARARSVCAEVSTGMTALRNAMPVNIRARKSGVNMNAEIQADIDRVCDIWKRCRTQFQGPWLFGEFCIADIIFAPVATRFQSYAVPLDGEAKSYQQAILSHPLVLEWVELSQLDNSIIEASEVGC